VRGASIDPPGYDAGKKIKGKKRHILVDTQGLLLRAIVHAADIQDRDGGVLLMSTLNAPTSESSWYCPNAGSSSARSVGATGVAAWPKIGNV
jgi:hypothetical protein